MGERKGLTKYYPPDFDPSKLSRVKKPKDREISSHFMLPMSIRCLTCGEFMGAGLKFNAKKSTAQETYFGTRIFRFSMKCKACPATFVIKTDPEHSDYMCEAGAKRNFQPWRAEKEVEDEQLALRDEQDQDAIQALENKTLDAKEEMDELDALDELKASKALAARITADDLLERHRAVHEQQAGSQGLLTDAQLEKAAREAFAEKRTTVRRLYEGLDTANDADQRHNTVERADVLQSKKPNSRVDSSASSSSTALLKRPLGNGLLMVSKKKKPKTLKLPNPSTELPEPEDIQGSAPATGAGLAGIADYGQSSDEDSSSSDAS
jgi:hypothetical protein